jgi:hypothetical protein
MDEDVKKTIAILVILVAIVAVMVGAVLTFNEPDDNKDIKLYQRYEETQSQWKSVYDGFYTGQIFTVNSTHVLTRIDLFVSKVETPNGLFMVSIADTAEVSSGKYKPTNVLVSTSTPCIDLPDTRMKWMSFNFSTEITLEPGVYAWYVSAPDANLTDFPRIERVENGDYLGGHAVTSPDGGGAWGAILLADYPFREYGYA